MKSNTLIKRLLAAPVLAATSLSVYAADSTLATNANNALDQAKADGESVGAKVIAAVVVIVGLSLVIALIRKV